MKSMNSYYDTYRLIFAYYIMDEITDLHKFHLGLLSNVINIFNYVDIYLLYDDKNKIKENKDYIISKLNRNDINFIEVKNNPNLREGQIYKNYIIDKLDQYDELIFFGHTKGITNSVNLEQIYNTKLWIAIMYYFNIYYYKEMSEDFLFNKSLSWGAIYNYDENNTTKYHWQYTGSFQWINCKELVKYIKDNNIDISEYNYKRKIFTCAEEFLGNTFDPKYAAFLNHQKYNKYFSHFLHENSTLPYYNISWVGLEIVDIDSCNNFWNFYNNFTY